MFDPSTFLLFVSSAISNRGMLRDRDGGMRIVVPAVMTAVMRVVSVMPAVSVMSAMTAMMRVMSVMSVMSMMPVMPVVLTGEGTGLYIQRAV